MVSSQNWDKRRWFVVFSVSQGVAGGGAFVVRVELFLVSVITEGENKMARGKGERLVGCLRLVLDFTLFLDQCEKHYRNKFIKPTGLLEIRTTLPSRWTVRRFVRRNFRFNLNFYVRHSRGMSGVT